MPVCACVCVSLFACVADRELAAVFGKSSLKMPEPVKAVFSLSYSTLTSLSHVPSCLAVVFLLLLPPRAALSVSALTSAGAKGRWLLFRLCLSCCLCRCLCLYLCFSCRCHYFCGCCLSLCACAKSQRLRFLVCLYSALSPLLPLPLPVSSGNSFIPLVQSSVINLAAKRILKAEQSIISNYHG